MKKRLGVWGICISLAGALTAWAQPTVMVEAPESGAVYPEFSSPRLRVRVENGDGTLRYFADHAGDYDYLLLFTNVGPSATHEVQLTNLSPGEYNIPVMTRSPDGDGDFVTNHINFTVTNRDRQIPKYTVTVLPGGTNTVGTRINNKGQVIGTSEGKAFLYDGEMHFLGSLGGAKSEATGINNNGEVVGVSDDGTGVRRAFIWDAQNGMRQLPVNGAPSDINDVGEIIGNGAEGAFLYRNGNIIQLLGTALDINNRGVVALGESSVVQTREGSKWNDFPTFGRPLVYGEDPPHVSAVAINDANQVTGSEYSSIGGGRYMSVYAFRYRAFHRSRLGGGGGTSYGEIRWARSINLLGDLVGSISRVTYGPRGSTASEGPPQAFVESYWQYRILNDAIPERGGLDVTNAVSINDRREIVAVASKGGETLAVLLQPIPEFQTIAFDPDARKINATVDGLVSTRVRIEKSTNLKDWEFHSAQELTEAPLEIALPMEAGNGSTFLRISRD